MGSFLYFLYNAAVVPLLYVVFGLGVFVHPKVRQGFRGRWNLFRDLETEMSHSAGKNPRFWIHCSSMGEFEQAKPLIDRLRRLFPDGCIVVSFFSPSVFDHVQTYSGADCLCYLPFDSLRRAKRFISIVRPDVAIVIRHDLWPNHLWQLKKRGVPAVLVNCSIRYKTSKHLPIWLWAIRFLYEPFQLLLTVSKGTKDFCLKYRLGRGRVEVAGDTRYDQVVRRAREAENIVASLRKIKGNRLCVVAGSTWPSDEDVLFGALERLNGEGLSMWVVLVPHEPSAERTRQLEERISKMGLRSHRLSELDGGRLVTDGEFLIVDRMGILASLYALGELAYVGGGFGLGIHNVLEPAALGKAVLFGPRSTNSFEAGQFERYGVGFIVRDSQGLYEILSSLVKDGNRLAEMGRTAQRLVGENVGATDRIVEYIKDLVRSG